jgi:hypothetical protein
MKYPVKLVELLKHTDVEITTWNLQVNVNVVTVRRTWINTDHTTATTGNVDIQASSTRTSNSQRLSQWKAERNQVVINLKAEEVHAQRQSLQPDRRHNTDWSTKQSWSEPDLPVKQYRRSTYTETITHSQTDDTTQTDQQSSHDQSQTFQWSSTEEGAGHTLAGH